MCWLTVAVLTVAAVVPLVGNQLRVQDFDPQFMRNIIERMHRFGGTFYQNGIYNKGPLEPIVYDLARHLGGYDGMWFLVSVFAALAALTCAFVAARIAYWRGAPAALALATGAVLYLHLTVSPSDYAGVLYARNMTVALLAVAWAVTFAGRFWQSPRARTLSSIAVGALLGFVVQALVSEVFVAAAVGLGLVAMVWHRPDPDERVKLVTLAVGSSAAAFLAAPVWYVLRGRFSEYWTSWYGHAHLMAVGTQRSLRSQFELGWREMYSYYQHRPLAFLAIVAFVVLTYLTWPNATWRARVAHSTLLGWLAGSWLEQVLNQRYSSHYFVINTVPTALMIAVLVGYAGRALGRKPRFAKVAVALPLAAVVGTLYLSGWKDFRDAAERTSKFTSFGDTAREVEKNQSPDVQSERGVLDLVSRDDDPILAWTNEPWPYLEVHRVSAGRFIWKSFLVGEVYLGATGPQYVLPHTWEWFREDVRRTKPVAFVKTKDDPAAGTPFADLVNSQFQLAYPGKHAVYLRTDVARRVVAAGLTTSPWSPPGGLSAGSGWSTGPGSATYGRSAVDPSSDALTLARRNCVRIDGTLETKDATPAFDVRLEDTERNGDGEPRREPVHLKLEGGKASSGSDAAQYESIPSGVQPGGGDRVAFSIVVGRRAAALVVGGQIRAATRIPSSVTVSMRSLAPALGLSDLRTGPAPTVAGC